MMELPVHRARDGQAAGLQRAGGRPGRLWRHEAIATPRSASESVLLMEAGLYLQTAFVQPMRAVGQFHDSIVLLILLTCFVSIGDLKRLSYTHIVQTDWAA